MEKQHSQAQFKQGPKVDEQGKKAKDTQKQDKGQFSKLIIEMMKKTRKNSPLFKPIKKLKTSIEAIGGQNRVSFYEPTNNLVVFHFGLGNQIDKQILLNGTTLLQDSRQKNKLAKQFVILPGKAFSFIQFISGEQACRFVGRNQLINILVQLTGQKEKDSVYESNQMEPLFYFKQIGYKNLSRLMIFFYLKSDTPGLKGQGQNPLINIPNCPLNHGYNNHIQGLDLIEEFLSQEQQLKLLEWIDSQPWQKLSNRRVQHYGFEFKYGRNQIDKDQIYRHKMPRAFQFVLQRLANLTQQLSGEALSYDQLTINDYFAGHGIPSHFDTHSPFQEYFVAISMLSGIVMDWRRYDGTQKSTYLKQRSLVVFSGEVRYAWLHSIACRKLDNIDNQLKHRSRRISLTFRKIKMTPCKCKYYFYCDSQGYDQQTMKKNNPLLTKYLCEQNEKKLKNLSKQKIYKQFVVKAYNSFGYDFHNKVIPEIKQYLSQQCQKIEKDGHSNSFILDIGCGNGQYKKHLNSQKIYYVGAQKCQIMIPVQEQVHMDGLRLGFKSQTFDIILLIAVLHHFTTEQDRIKCLSQAKRVLSNDGTLYLTVFNFEGKKQYYPNQDILLDYCLPNHKVIDRTQNQLSQEQRKLMPVFPKSLECQQGKQTQRGEIFTRYYHLFTIQQTEDIVLKSGLKIQQLKTSKQNIIVKLTK